MTYSLTKNPSFNNSSFFDSKTHPSLEDQVVLCRQIARQLVCDENNAKSKGREMFEKRVEKSSKWVTTSTTPKETTEDDTQSEQSFHETTISEGPPNLRLVLDPRHVKDLSCLDFEANETEIIERERESKSQSKEIVSDLTSPDIHHNKGNALFMERQRKSEEWIVESVVESVVAKAREKTTTPTTPTTETTEEPLMPCFKLNVQSNKTRVYRDFNARAKPYCR